MSTKLKIGDTVRVIGNAKYPTDYDGKTYTITRIGRIGNVETYHGYFGDYEVSFVGRDLRRVHRAELKLTAQELSRWSPLLTAGELDYDAHGITKFATCDMWTADFGNGIIADLKVCASDTDEPIWCECVFFRVEGGAAHECACTDVSDTLTGDWTAEIDGDEYTVTVVQA